MEPDKPIPTGQRELFPDEIKEWPCPKRTDIPAGRGESRAYSKTPRYKIVTIPDWIREGRNRDTNSNLDWQ